MEVALSLQTSRSANENLEAVEKVIFFRFLLSSLEHGYGFYFSISLT
jgi:hypothetical protein